MNKRIRNKWIKALRSGEYKQGKNRLFDSLTQTYCCLGVLKEVCDIKSISELLLETFKSSPEEGYYRAPVLLPHDVQAMLGDANDNLDYSFEDIAVIVEHL